MVFFEGERMGKLIKHIRIDCNDIILRTYESYDLDSIYSITQEEDVKKYLPDWNVPKSQRQEWLNEYEIPENNQFLSAVSKDGRIGDLRIRLGIVLKETNELIGWCCSGVKVELTPPSREIMFAISKDYRNHGYTSQAVQGLVKFLFDYTDVGELSALALINNIPSNRVIQKSKFEFSSTIDLDGNTYNYYKIYRSKKFKAVADIR